MTCRTEGPARQRLGPAWSGNTAALGARSQDEVRALAMAGQFGHGRTPVWTTGVVHRACSAPGEADARIAEGGCRAGVSAGTAAVSQAEATE